MTKTIANLLLTAGALIIERFQKYEIYKNILMETINSHFMFPTTKRPDLQGLYEWNIDFSISKEF
jgi:hypothetical protein